MVTLTNREIIEARAALMGLAKIIWPGATALKIKRMWREVNTAFQDYESLRNEALERLAKRDEKGKLVTSAEGNAVFETAETAQEFAAYVRELLDAPVECRHTLTEAEATSRDVAPQLIIALGPLCVEDEEGA
jgi:hypothetical protein